jgi:fluoride exporter
VTAALLVALGAAVGAPLRFVVDRLIQRRARSAFPWGTLVVNVAGSFVLGVLLGGTAWFSDAAVLAVGVGFCGAFTTYSTFGYETVRLLDDGSKTLAAANVLVSLTLGLGAACLGWLVGAALR